MKKILYLECKTGAAGDMLMGALYGLLTEEQKVLFLEKLNAISEEVCVIPQEICKQGIGGIHMKVEINGTEEGTEAHHHHEHNHHEEEHGHTNIIMSMNMLKNMYILMKKCIFILMMKDIHTIMTMRIAMHMVIIPIQVLLLFWSRFQSWI